MTRRRVCPDCDGRRTAVPGGDLHCGGCWGSGFIEVPDPAPRAKPKPQKPKQKAKSKQQKENGDWSWIVAIISFFVSIGYLSNSFQLEKDVTMIASFVIAIILGTQYKKILVLLMLIMIIYAVSIS